MKTKFLATAAVSAALLTGGVAVAATSILPAYAQSSTTTAAQGSQPSAKGQHAKHPRLREAAKAGIKTAADTIGIAPKDLVTELRSGTSIADVAREHDVDPQKVVDAYVTKADARIDQAVQGGKLTQDKADKLKAKAPELATKVVNKTRGQHHTAGDGAANPTQPGTSSAPAGGSAPSTAAPAPSSDATNQLGGDTTTAPSGSLTGG
jgi:hypothetical protein